MKKLFVVLLICLVGFPLIAGAEEIKVKGDQAKVLGFGLEFDTAKQGKVSVAMGQEKIYLNGDLTSASFKKDAEHTFKHDLYYSCFGCDKHRRVPGKCACGMDLVPSFKHGQDWHKIGRDAEGKLLVDPDLSKAAPAADAAQPACGPDCDKPCCKGDFKAHCEKMLKALCPDCAAKCKEKCQAGDKAACKDLWKDLCAKCQEMCKAKCKGMGACKDGSKSHCEKMMKALCPDCAAKCQEKCKAGDKAACKDMWKELCAKCQELCKAHCKGKAGCKGKPGCKGKGAKCHGCKGKVEKKAAACGSCPTDSSCASCAADQQ